MEAIKNDESIPVRANKKTGKKSKKEVREEVSMLDLPLSFRGLTDVWLNRSRRRLRRS